MMNQLNLDWQLNLKLLLLKFSALNSVFSPKSIRVIVI